MFKSRPYPIFSWIMWLSCLFLCVLVSLILDLQVFLERLLLFSFHMLYGGEKKKKVKHLKEFRFPATSQQTPFDALHL